MPKQKKYKPEPTLRQLDKIFLDTCNARLEDKTASQFKSRAREFVEFCNRFNLDPRLVDQKMLSRYAAYQKYHYNNGKECIRGHMYGIRNAAMATGIDLNIRSEAMPALHAFYDGRLKEK
eukprot:185098_1